MKSVPRDSARGPHAAVDPRATRSARTLRSLNGFSPNGLGRNNGAAAHAEVGSLRVVSDKLRIKTGQAPDFVDITDRVAEIVWHSGVRNGQALVFSLHTTAAVRVQEAEPLLIEDLTACLERLAPADLEYRHNDFRVRTVNMHDNESPNGHAHCRHLFLGASETIPVVDGRLVLGHWQRLFIVELDRSRHREVHVQVLGIG